MGHADPGIDIASRRVQRYTGKASDRACLYLSKVAPEIVRNRMIVTAVLTTGIARVTHGLEQSEQLIDEVLRTDHAKWETTMSIGDVEFRSTKEGPQPNHQLRISVRPSLGLAALNYTDHDDPEMAIANSYNPRRPLPEVDLIFNGTTGMVFPRTALISIDDARSALSEWLGTCKRPACIQWRPYEPYGSD